MCGITFYSINNKNQFNKNELISYYKSKLLESSKNIRHRGPDWSGNYVHSSKKSTIFMAHERLSIIDPFKGKQPIIYDNGDYTISLAVNGEIYNYKELKNEWNNYKYQTESDCEVIISGYLELFNEMFNSDSKSNFDIKNAVNKLLNKLDGQFAFVLYDSRNGNILIGRDAIGIASLYYGFDNYNNLMICSEMKGLDLCTEINQFPPGNALFINDETNIKSDNFNTYLSHYYINSNEGNWLSLKSIPDDNLLLNNEQKILEVIRTTLIDSVHKRLMSDVPFGVLLSGGLDSSLVSSIAVQYLKKNKEFSKWGNKIHSFSIGLSEDSPDLIKAKEVASFLDTNHHNFLFTIQEGLDAVRDVIYHLETYDITTIRASTPMYLLSRKIKATGVKMVLSGEGADELLGGYLYFLNAPNNNEFFLETQKRVRELNFFDCLRANKSTLAWGLESRFPFLDKKFIECAFKINPQQKHKNNTIEKYCLRKAFDVKDENGKPVYLPDSVLWRQKEQFGDGVGYSWIDTIRNLGENQISDNEFETRKIKYPHNTPYTKEAFMYRKIFEELFPQKNREKTVKMWIPRTDWGNTSTDPSGRAQKIHNEKY